MANLLRKLWDRTQRKDHDKLGWIPAFPVIEAKKPLNISQIQFPPLEETPDHIAPHCVSPNDTVFKETMSALTLAASCVLCPPAPLISGGTAWAPTLFRHFLVAAAEALTAEE